LLESFASQDSTDKPLSFNGEARRITKKRGRSPKRLPFWNRTLSFCAAAPQQRGVLPKCVIVAYGIRFFDALQHCFWSVFSNEADKDELRYNNDEQHFGEYQE
jgi:hypothetical protein